MRKHSNIRLMNGIVSAVVLCFFIAHGLLGSTSALSPFETGLTWVVWIGMACVGVHLILSMVTSWQQLNDPGSPPSARKKRHLVLKWTTGLLLLVAVVVHIGFMRSYGPAATQSMASGAVATIAVAATFALHACVGGKSLLTDIFIDKKYLVVYRVVVCAFAAVCALATIAGVVL